MVEIAQNNSAWTSNYKKKTKNNNLRAWKWQPPGSMLFETAFYRVSYTVQDF